MTEPGMNRVSRNARVLPSLSSPNNRIKCNYENVEIIDLWTSAFLSEFDRPKTAFRKSPSATIAFGRTTHSQQNQAEEAVRPRTTTNVIRPLTSARSHVTLFAETKLSQNRAAEALKKRETILAPVTGQESKFRGQQLHNFKIDLSIAKEKRKRQIQYSREIASGAKSQKQREIDSITRIVVQGFKKLIDCERCALFLKDKETNELYFKPVGEGDHSHARLKPIRFPATSGVAGWVASHQMMCNIKNVISSTNELLGVIQMVNKRKGDAKELRDRAKKKKSDNTNKGYQSQYESFSKLDEEILGKCCVEVSKSLEEIFNCNNQIKKEYEHSDQTADHDDISGTQVKDSAEESSDDDSSCSQEIEPVARQVRGRRSSLGSLAQFVRRQSAESEVPISNHQILANEAAHRYQFRDIIGSKR
eukprot:scaffold3617_cov24-Cyclotella_meneghiniana.AAC.2